MSVTHGQQAPSRRRRPTPDAEATGQRAEARENPLLTLQRTVGNRATQRLLRSPAAVGRLIGPSIATGNRASQRLLRAPAAPGAGETLDRAPRGPDEEITSAVEPVAAAPAAGMLTDLGQPAGGWDDRRLAQRLPSTDGARPPTLWRSLPAGPAAGQVDRLRARQAGGIIQQADGPMRSPASAPTIQRKIGDGHDLKSARLKGDAVLEACFDNNRVLQQGSAGPSVIKIQHALTDLGFRMPGSGIDGQFGKETKSQVKSFQKSAGLKDDGVVGQKTMEALDSQLLTGAGGPGPLPSATPAPGTKAAPTLAAVINTGPTAGINGQMNFVINWQLGGNAGPKGGFIIQDVLFVFKAVDKKGKVVPNADPRTSPLNYFEAWRVAPNSKTLTPVTTDTFFWPGAAPWAGDTTRGRVTIVGTAHYFDDVAQAQMPAHMVANNKATFAGGLQSSLADPALPGNQSGAVAHSLAFHWDSTKKSNQPTVLDANTP